MYISISPQKTGAAFSKSAGDFVSYLEKENEGKSLLEKEYFFNQYDDKIQPYEVIKGIDGNTAELKAKEPKYYSITMSPSQYELKHIRNNPEKLKAFVRDAMKEYAGSFNREINGGPINVDDIKYYAKIEYERSYKSNDLAIRENKAYSKQIAQLKNELRKVERGKFLETLKNLKRKFKN